MVISKLPDGQDHGAPLHYADDGDREEFDKSRMRYGRQEKQEDNY